MSVWSYRSLLRLAFSFADFCAAYFATILGRCALLSLAVLLLVLLLRSTALRSCTFTKGAIWAVFAPILFLGKLRAYYEENPIYLLFFHWQNLCSGYWWVRWGYLLGVAVSVWLLCCRRIKLRRLLRRLPSGEIDGQRVYFCEWEISPFTAGVLHPKIVFPGIALEQLDPGELRLVLLHEQIHIRSAHLWYFLLWDILSALLWINPLLRLSTPKLKEDMEQICDTMTIRHSGGDALAYGHVLLKIMALFPRAAMDVPAAFADEADFAEFRQRIIRVRAYRPYSCLSVFVLRVFLAAALLAAVYFVHCLSLPQYTTLSGYTVFRVENDVDFIKIYDTADGEPPLTLIGRDTAEIDNVALRAILPEDSPENGCYCIMWGGFLKVPGMGGGMNSVYIDGLADGATTAATFSDINEHLFVRLAKWI